MPPDRLLVLPAIARNREQPEPDTAAPIPCHRCGVCCMRWQPLLTPADAATLAAQLGLRIADFHARYTLPYPFDDQERLLQQEAGSCIFLAWEADGRSTCTVHAARPAVCRAWGAGLEKRECRDGFARALRADGRLELAVLYPEREDQATFLETWTERFPEDTGNV